MKLESMPDVVGLQAGSLADPSRFVPAMDVFANGAQPWDHMQPERKKFPRGLATWGMTSASDNLTTRRAKGLATYSEVTPSRPH